ncbi:MAG: hypothetical protein GY869_14685 [Planctomycetes bacterium]|nr:hypothetical protein [Planctomycetota bacterium]
MAKKKEIEIVELPALEINDVDLTLIGDSSLVCHRWSEKAKKMMRDKQTKKATQGREAKKPEQEFMDTLYPLDGKPVGKITKGRKWGFPAIAFKAAAVRAATDVGMNMTDMRRAFHISGDLVEIEGTPRMREDLVRLNGKTADLRYRAEFQKWKASFRVRYNKRVISAEQLMNLFNTAGFGVGVGEHRPEKNGAWGMFHVL